MRPPRILVIGSANTDMIIRVPRLPRPGETILGGDLVSVAGGKGANQAVSAARAGGRVTFIGSVGADEFGRRTLAGLRRDGIDTRHVVRDSRHASGVALISVAGNGENSIAVAPGANAHLSPTDVRRAAHAFSRAEILVTQLETPLRTLITAVELAAQRGLRVLLNPAPAQSLPHSLLRRISILTPNETEAELLTGVKVGTHVTAARAAHALRSRGVQTVIITLGARGAFVSDADGDRRVPAFRVKAVDTTAAGDVFNGALAVSLSEGNPVSSAVRFAHAAAALSVTRIGAQPSAPTRSEIIGFLGRHRPGGADSRRKHPKPAPTLQKKGKTAKTHHVMKSLKLLIGAAALWWIQAAPAHEIITRVRSEVNIPDIPGYLTLKGDFHIHTVFSDGEVWPSVRSEEAWREGLDVIAITDHIEYLPHKNDLPKAHERSYEIARPAGEELEVMVIKGSEVTRSMPPGHLNAVFLTNSTALDVTRWQDALAAAHAQGAFIFWNHPGWPPQLKDGKVTWYPEHTALVEQGLLDGIEVVNGRDYAPEAHRWALEKNLTMLSNSDIHAPLNLDYHVHDADHRPITLVFARERTPEAVKEALFDRRTAVYSGDKLIGKEEFLRPIFENSIQISKRRISLKGNDRLYLQIHNTSDIDYRLEGNGDLPLMHFPWWLTLPAGKTALLEVRRRSETATGTHTLDVPYKVTNLLIGPDEPMPVNLTFEVTFAPRPGGE